MKMTAVLLLALGGVVVLRHRSAALRHWVLAAGVACAAMVPLLEAIVPAWPLPLSDTRPIFAAPRAASRTITNPEAVAVDNSVEQLVVSTSQGPTSGGISDGIIARWRPLVWFGGMFCSFAILLTGLGRLMWLAGNSARLTHGRWVDLANEIAHEYGMHRPFLLLQSDHPTLLVTWGLALPKIILPASAVKWSDERARVVLSHELAHIQRGDWNVQMFAELLRGIYWFNPMVWIVCRRLRLESEHACDDQVMSRGLAAGDYAAHLLELATSLNRRPHTWFPAPAMARPSSLERRVRAMLNDRLNRAPIGAATRATVFFLLLSVTAALSAAQNMFQTFSGTVVDGTGRPVPEVTIALDNAERKAQYQVKSNNAGAFEFVGMPSGTYTLLAQFVGFAPLRETLTLNGANVQRRLQLQIGSLQETINVTVAVDERAATTAPTVREASMPDVSGCVATATGGRIVAPKKVRDVHPQYPAHLRGSGTEGVVLLQARIGLDGFLTDIQVLREAHPDLASAAVAAVREWRFSPTLLNCSPVEPSMMITTNFRAIPPPPPAPPKP